MGWGISALKIPDNSYQFLRTGSAETGWLLGLSKINIFVAPNNSGKSRFIRSIAKSNSLTYLPKDIDFKILDDDLNKLKGEIMSFLSSNGIDPDGLGQHIRAMPVVDHCEEIQTEIDKYFKMLDSKLESLDRQMNTSTGAFTYPAIANKVREIIKIRKTSNIDNFLSFSGQKFEKYYMPMLRGLRGLGDDSTDYYQNRTIKDYFPEETKPIIETGLGFNTLVKKHLLGDLAQRETIREYERFLSKNFFESSPIALIPKEEGGMLTIKVGDEKELPISQLGDGLQSIIVLTMPIFLNRKDKLLVFIEEPEHCLHPGFQRKPLQTLLTDKNFDNCQYLVTTHSNHFLDISQDFSETSIYRLSKVLPEDESREKTPKFTIEKFEPGDKKLLESLGVNKSSVFLSNCTIWIEGITDRYYLRKYLEVYVLYLKQNKLLGDEYKEDLHYSFVEYSGANISHWFDIDNSGQNIEVERLCGKVYLICDMDDPANKKQRVDRLKEILGEGRFKVLPGREIENLLSAKVLREVVSVHEHKDIQEVPEFDEKEYKDKYLGRYLEEKLGKDRKRKYADDSGTIFGKLDFCREAMAAITTWDDLSESAKKLTEEVYKFVGDNNK